MPRRKPRTRCTWVTDDAEYIAYHDEEWGVPVYDDRVLFEFIVLESQQAGLSWLTILKKRSGYRRAFVEFDAARVSRFTAKRIDTLVQDARIVRHRGKLEATVANGAAVLAVQKEYGSLAEYLWGFVGGRPIVNRRRHVRDIPVTTPESVALAKDMKKRGFRFFGPTTAYAFMQAVGMVNDHTTDCFRYAPVRKTSPRRK